MGTTNADDGNRFKPDTIESVMTGVQVKASGGRGLGVFAMRLFAGDECIRVVNIEREVTDEHPLSPEDNPDHAFMSDGNFLLVGEPDRYLNHF
jgi:hypothetical protein